MELASFGSPARQALVVQGELPGSAAAGTFGFSVAIEGDTAIVGAPALSTAGAGVAHLVVRHGATWREQQALVPDDSEGGVGFGWSVALSHDTALVSAPFRSGESGTVYVFTRSGTTWSQQQKLTPRDELSIASFGHAVALLGNTALISSTERNNNTGAAYIFVRKGVTWSQEQRLLASDGSEGDGFGQSVALTDDRALVGAPFKDARLGAAYIFARHGWNVGTWSQEQILTGADATAGDFFGGAVALSGPGAVVGAPAKNAFLGAAYVFAHNGTRWSQQQKLVSSDGETSVQLGSSVALSGHTALIGAPSSAAYLFTLRGATWSQQQTLRAPAGEVNDAFALGVALSAGSALIGAPQKNANTGIVYFFAHASCP
jgi:hypothetical protein